MFQVARSWDPDAQVLTMNSIHLTDVPAVRGESGAWQAVFISPSKASQRGYTFSVVEGELNLHQGVFPGAEESAGAKAAGQAFLIGAVKTDSDAAYKTGQMHAAEYDAKHADQTISFELSRQAVSQN